MCGCRLACVDDTLRAFFGWLGLQIGLRPGYFIIVPLLLTALCASGFQRIFYEADPEYLFSPVNGAAKAERAILEEHFPMNYSAYDPGRVSRAGRFGRLLFEARDNGTLLRQGIWNQILYVDELVRNVTIDGGDGYAYMYQDICAQIITGGCWPNEILGLGRYMRQIESGEMAVTYPIWFDPQTFQRYTFPFFTGGVSLHPEDHTITDLKKLSLQYFLVSETPDDKTLGSKWEDAFLKLAAAQNLPDVNVLRFSSLTLEVELENNTNSVIPFFSLNLAIMITFCIITCMMTDWVKSKPLLGLFGVISAILATIASLGMVMYCGVPFIGINLAAPFLMLGIGIDDTFVMLGAWRRTSIHAAVPERMSEAFKDAAVSITITSVTDMLSFWIGIITPFPCVRIFCIYTGACVVFTYVWHITFFGAGMAISGYAERQNRHALTCLPVIPKSLSKSKGFLYNVFCSGGVNKEDPLNAKDNRENGVMVFFRDRVGTALNKVSVKITVMIVFFAYLGVSAWAVTYIEEGLERRKLSRYDSYSVDFYDVEDVYFREYPYRINVVISGIHDYSDPKVQAGMENLLTQLENTTFIDPTYTESWLRDFLDYVRRNEDYSPIDISTEHKFISSLQTLYLSAGPTPYNQDVDFSEDNSHIEGARFMIQGSKIYNAYEEKLFVEELRAVCHGSVYNVTVFHPYFIYFDQFLMVLPTTIQCVSVAAVVMMIVSLVLIPNPLCSLWVAFSIMSIELGVVGFMTLWGVNLDSISMINLIMCIGFSVDFSAHISYHFMSRRDMEIEDRVMDSMYALGLPITQGAISTILGVIGLALAPSYIFITFFKMVFLVIVLGAMHGLILLPVLLSFFGPGACCGNTSGSDNKKATKVPKSATNHKGQQTYEEDTEMQVSMRIPRPKQCHKHSKQLNSSEVAKNGHQRRRSRSDSVNGAHSNGTSAANNNGGIRLHEMYTNRAFQD